MVLTWSLWFAQAGVPTAKGAVIEIARDNFSNLRYEPLYIASVATVRTPAQCLQDQMAKPGAKKSINYSCNALA